MTDFVRQYALGVVGGVKEHRFNNVPPRRRFSVFPNSFSASAPFPHHRHHLDQSEFIGNLFRKILFYLS